MHVLAYERLHLHIILKCWIGGRERSESFRVPFRPVLIRLVKIFNLGLQLKIDWEWVSIYPLVGNLKISSATLKTFCLESMSRYSHSNKGPVNNRWSGGKEKAQTRPSLAGEVVRPWCDYLPFPQPVTPTHPPHTPTHPPHTPTHLPSCALAPGSKSISKVWKALTESSNSTRIKGWILSFFCDYEEVEAAK